MKTNKYIVAFDMLPLSKERLESWDYNSMIFFKMFGNPILDIDKNVVIEGKRVIVQNLSKDTLISIEKKLDYILNNWTDIHALWFIGIKITKDNHIYTKKNNSIYVDFSDEKRIYPFLCLLKSYFFYIEEDSVNIIWGKRKIEVTNTLIDKTIILKKIKYPVINILLFQLHNIDITANTIFPFRLYPIYKKSSLFFSEKSGIEMLLICTNTQSNYYNNKMLRQCIFEKIDSKLILNKLECNLCFSENMYIDYFPDDKHYSDKVVISYDDYYPNKIVMKLIKKQLKKHNISVELERTNFNEINEIADLRLFLMPRFNGDIIFNFYMLAIILGMRKSKEEYRNFLRLTLEYYADTEKRVKILEEIKDIFREKYLYYSIGEVKSTYLCRKNSVQQSYEEIIRYELGAK